MSQQAADDALSPPQAVAATSHVEARHPLSPTAGVLPPSALSRGTAHA